MDSGTGMSVSLVGWKVKGANTFLAFLIKHDCFDLLYKHTIVHNRMMLQLDIVTTGSLRFRPPALARPRGECAQVEKSCSCFMRRVLGFVDLELPFPSELLDEKTWHPL
jgi:hypothetical protein